MLYCAVCRSWFRSIQTHWQLTRVTLCASRNKNTYGSFTPSEVEIEKEIKILTIDVCILTQVSLGIGVEFCRIYLRLL